MPENTKYVGRPTKWGNPFKLSPDGWILYYNTSKLIGSPWCYYSLSNGFEIKDVVELYGLWLDGILQKIRPCLPTPPSIEELKGMDLACFCSISNKKNEYTPCHADILLSLSNNIPLKDVINENICQEKLLRRYGE